MTDSINQEENTNCNQKPRLLLSFLLSKEEYVSFTLSLLSRRSRRGTILRRGIGMVLLLVGIAGLLFRQDIRLQPAVCSLLMLVGVFLALYDWVIAPLFRAAAAAGEYEGDRSRHTAKRYTFTDDTVKMEEGDSFITLPLSLVTEVYRVESGIILSFDGAILFMIPDRVLSSEEKQTLATLLDR